MKSKRLLVFVMVLVLLLSAALAACNTKDDVTYGEWVVDTLPTDTDTGLLKRQGSDGKDYTFKLPALTDELYSKKVISDATINSDGVTRYTISVMDVPFSFDIVTPKIVLRRVKEIPATAGTNGTKEYYVGTDGTRYLLGLDGGYVRAKDSELVIDADTRTLVINVNDDEIVRLYRKGDEQFGVAVIENIILENIGSDTLYALYGDTERTIEVTDADIETYINADANVELYAFEKYDINVHPSNGTEYSVEAEYGETYSSILDVTKTGYDFVGIYDNVEHKGNVIDNEIITKATDVYAKYVLQTSTITFDSMGGSKVDAIEQDVFSVVTAPVAPTRTGATFMGWYIDSECTTEYVFDKMPLEDITLYAKWQFNFTEGLEFVKVGETYKVTNYTGTSKDVVIPDTFDGLPVVAVDAGAFDRTKLLSIHIGDNIERIDSRLIVDEKVTIKITGAKNLKYIGESVLSNAKVESIDFPSLIDLPSMLFYGVTAGSVNLPKVKTIGAGAFTNFTTERLSLPSVSELNLPIFKGANIQYITMENLAVAHAKFIDNNSYVKEISLPNLTSNPSDFIDSCANLTKVDFANMTKLGTNTIKNCNSLVTINCPSLLTMAGNAIIDCSSIGTLDLAKIENISSNAIINSDVAYLMINKNLTGEHAIDINAFQNVNIKKLAVTAPVLYSVADHMAYCEEIFISGGDLVNGNISSINGLKKVVISDLVKNAAIYSKSESSDVDVYLMTDVLPEGFHSSWISKVDGALLFSENEPTMEQWLSVEGYWHGTIDAPIKWQRPYARGLMLEPIKNGAEYGVSKYYNVKGPLTIPETYKGKKITTIMSGAFSNNNRIDVLGGMLENISMPYIENIESGAFTKCVNILSIDAPKVVNIADNAFVGCDIKKITLASTGEGTYSPSMADATTTIHTIYIPSKRYQSINADRVTDIHIVGTDMATGDISGNHAKQYTYIEDSVINAASGAIAADCAVDIFMKATSMPEGFASDFNASTHKVYLYSAEEPTSAQWSTGHDYWRFVDNVPTPWTLNYTRGLIFDDNGYLVQYVGTAKDVFIPRTYRGIAINGIKANVFANMSLDSIVFNTARDIVIDDTAFKGANITQAHIMASMMKKLDVAASYDVVEIIGDKILAGEIATVKDGATLYIATSVNLIESGAIGTAVTSNIYFRHSTMMPEFHAGFNAGSGKAYFYKENEPLSDDWIVYDYYWHYDVNGNITPWVLNHTKGLEFKKDTSGNYVVSGYIGTDVDVDIPLVYGGANVVGIGVGAFENNANILSVNLTSNIVSIGDAAFRGCTALNSISGIENITTLGANVFDGCTFESLDFASVEGAGCNEQAFKGLSVSEIRVDASLVKYLQYATLCNVITVGGTSLSTGDIPKIDGNSIIFIPTTLVEALDGAVTVDCTSKVYVEWTTTPAQYVDTWTAHPENLYVYSVDEPTSQMWATYEHYWYRGVNGVPTEWTCDYPKGMVFVDAVEPSDGTYMVSSYVGSLTDIVIPDTYNGGKIVAIGGHAFMNNKTLKTITLGNNITSIGAMAFSGSTSLTTINGGNNVASIGDSAFESVTMLGSISFPNVKTIGTNTFFGDDALVTVSLPVVETIGANAFAHTMHLESVDIPNVVSIGNDAFSSSALGGDIVLNKLTTLGGSAFSRTKITTFVAPILETAMGYSFSNCSQLTSVNLGKLTTITNAMLSSCTALGEVIAPNVTVIEDRAFADTYKQSGTSSARIVFDMSNVTTIGSQAFRHGSIEVADLSSVVTINDAFRDCATLKEIRGSIKATDIPTYAFDGCTALSGTVNMPNATTIGDYAFYGCSSLLHVTMPNVTSIGIEAFRNTTLLEDVGTLEHLTSLKYRVFVDSGIKEISMPMAYENATVGDMFTGCSRLAAVSIPKAIGLNNTFRNCTSLTEVNFPLVKKVGDSVFEGCTALRTVTMPLLTELGFSAFKGAGDPIHGFSLSHPGNFVEILPNEAFANSNFVGGSFDNLKTVRYDIFRGMHLLGKMYFPVLTNIGQSSFMDVHGEMAELHFTSDVASVDHHIFENVNVKVFEFKKYTGTASRNTSTNSHAKISIGDAYDFAIGVLPRADLAILSGSTMRRRVLRAADKDVIIRSNITTSEAYMADKSFTGNIFFEHATIPTGFHAEWKGQSTAKVYMFSASRKTSGMPQGVDGYWHFKADGMTPEIWV